MGEYTLLVGPVFTRELAIAPRRPRMYVARAAYVVVLLINHPGIHHGLGTRMQNGVIEYVLRLGG